MVKHNPAHQQIADIFTKSLPAAAFQSLRFKLGVDVPPTPSLRGDISELSSIKAQVQTSSQSPAKTRLTREEKGKDKMYEEDIPCAVLQSKCDSSDSSDQRSQRVSLSKSKLDDKTQLKVSMDRAFCVKLSNAFSALDGEADAG